MPSSFKEVSYLSWPLPLGPTLANTNLSCKISLSYYSYIVSEGGICRWRHWRSMKFMTCPRSQSVYVVGAVTNTQAPSVWGPETQFLQGLSGNVGAGSYSGKVCSTVKNRSPVEEGWQWPSYRLERDHTMREYWITEGPRALVVCKSNPPKVPNSELSCWFKAHSMTTTN